jgi:hypothetical protein
MFHPYIYQFVYNFVPLSIPFFFLIYLTQAKKIIV